MTFPSNVTGKNWMSALDGRKSIADLSIPGTHDSGAIWGEFGLRGVAKSMFDSLVPAALRQSTRTPFIGDVTRPLINSVDSEIDRILKDLPNFNFAKDQDATIAEQLEMGVRMLDLRFRNINGTLYVYHAQSPQGQTANTALSTVRDFLKRNPTETVLIHTQQASSPLIDNSIPSNIRGKINQGIDSYNGARDNFFLKLLNLPKIPHVPELLGLPAKSVPTIPPIASGVQTLHIKSDKFGINRSFPDNGNNAYAPTLKKLINTYSDSFYLKSEMPSLNDVRGKMVLLDYNGVVGQGLQIPNTKDNTPDDPNLLPKTMDPIVGSKAPVFHFGGDNKYYMYVQNDYDSPSRAKKIRKFTNNLETVISGKFDNVFIYNFLSAYNSDTGVTNLGSRFYSDFLNPQLPGLLRKHKGTSQTGNILLDFMTPTLAKAIYETNDPDFFPQIKLTTTPAQNADLPLTRKDSQESICIGCIPLIADAGIVTDAQIYRYKGEIGADKSNDTRKILDSLAFAFTADEPVKWSLTGASSADFKLDAKPDFSTEAQLSYDSERSGFGHQSSLKDDYTSDTSTSATIELSDGTRKTLSGILNRAEGDSKLEFAVEAVDRYRNYSVSEFDITIEASETAKSHDVDWIRVGLEKDRPVKLDMMILKLVANNSKSYMTGIYDDTGSLVQTPVNSNNFIDTFTAPANGYYYIGLSADNTESDLSYFLDVTPIDGLPHDPNKRIEPTDDFSADIHTVAELIADNHYHQFGFIETTDDTDWFRIDLDKGAKVDFGFAKYSADPSISKHAVIHAIYDQSGRQIGNTIDKSFFNFTTPASGTYYLAVQSNISHQYELGATINNKSTLESESEQAPLIDDYSSDIATSANLDIKKKKNSLSGKIDHPFDSDWIRVGLEKGTKVSLDVASRTDGLNVFLNSIYDADGKQIPKTSNVDQFDAPEAGFYYLEIKPQQDQTGSYSVKVLSESGKQIADEDLIKAGGDDNIIGGDNSSAGGPAEASGEVFSINLPRRFKKRFVDKIRNFDSSKDLLDLDRDLFGLDSSHQGFASGRGNRTMKKILAKQDHAFLYDEKKGRLFFNENGSDKKFGEGGLIAILKGAPDISADHLQFL